MTKKITSDGPSYSQQNTTVEKTESNDDIFTQSKSIKVDKEFSEIQFKQEDTRGRFAIVFLIGFFIILTAGLVIGVFVETARIKNVTDMILTISGVLSGPLGFIIGYYFKRQEETNSK